MVEEIETPLLREARERAAQLRAQADAILARATQAARAEDTRRKILLGSLVMHDLRREGDDEEMLRSYLERRLPAFLTRDSDRALVERLPRPGDEPGAAKKRGRPRKEAPPENAHVAAAAGERGAA
ncbi:mobilization protein [Xanthobacter agilis]|uniref:mobilization protein n=1 Tax=Xanthobacter agilis TaxID=47492 RepID=UPI00372826CB